LHPVLKYFCLNLAAGQSHSVLAWCTGTRIKPTFTTKFTDIYHISQENFVCYFKGAPPEFTVCFAGVILIGGWVKVILTRLIRQ